MTRINGTILPRYLSDHHLKAEQKEILRIPLLVANHMEKDTLGIQDIPGDFTLGEGHLKFFYDKGLFIMDRAERLREEMELRGMEPKPINYYHFTEWQRYAKGLWWGKWVHFTEDEGKQANILVIERIISKMYIRSKGRKDYGLSYGGKKETPKVTIARLLTSIFFDYEH